MNTIKTKLSIITAVIFITLINGIFILKLLPKSIAFLLNELGFAISSQNLYAVYIMGTTVRVFAIVLCLLAMWQLNIKLNKFTFNLEYLKFSWIFFIYIIANIEIININVKQIPLVLLMILNTMCVGLYEELIFRGFALRLMLKHWGKSKKGIYFAVAFSSAAFGLLHIANLSKAGYAAVASQTVYAAMIGVFFAAVFIRTNGDVIWCSVLHWLFNMASDFAQIADAAEKSAQSAVAAVAATNAVDIMPYIIECASFLPLMLFGLFILRKAEWHE